MIEIRYHEAAEDELLNEIAYDLLPATLGRSRDAAVVHRLSIHRLHRFSEEAMRAFRISV